MAGTSSSPSTLVKLAFMPANELSSTREVLRGEVLGGTLTPQIVLRLGWPQAEPLPVTPRRTVQETVGRVPR